MRYTFGVLMFALAMSCTPKALHWAVRMDIAEPEREFTPEAGIYAYPASWAGTVSILSSFVLFFGLMLVFGSTSNAALTLYLLVALAWATLALVYGACLRVGHDPLKRFFF